MPPPHVRKLIKSVTRGAVPEDDEFWIRAKMRALENRVSRKAARAFAARQMIEHSMALAALVTERRSRRRIKRAEANGKSRR
jgi:hypothetical protein